MLIFDPSKILETAVEQEIGLKHSNNSKIKELRPILLVVNRTIDQRNKTTHDHGCGDHNKRRGNKNTLSQIHIIHNSGQHIEERGNKGVGTTTTPIN